MTKRKRIAIFTLTAVLIALIIGQMVVSMLTIRSDAATTNEFYTDVLDDLSKDERFDPANYPRMTLDYYLEINSDEDKTNDQAFMEVIQIAESTSGELYIYVYQPTHYELDLKARYVSLSTDFTPDGQNINPELYDLVLVSDYGVFDKYVVKDFNVSKDPERYYNIVMLERDFSDKIDEKIPGTEDEGNYFKVGVGQQWYFSYVNDKLVCEMNTFETVDVKITFTGSVSLRQGITLGNFVGVTGSDDLWFCTINIENFDVSKIFDADMSYKKRLITYYYGGGSEEYTEHDWSKFIEVSLDSSEERIHEGIGLGGLSFKWKDIMTSGEFIKACNKQDVKLNNPLMIEALTKNSSHVFIFAKTPKEKLFGDVTGEEYYDVGYATVLRIHFMDISGNSYNLGAVSDMVNPDNISDAVLEADFWGQLWKNIEKILEILCFIALVIILSPFIGPILSFFIELLKFVLNAVIYIFALPFRLLNRLLNKKD